MDNDQFQICGQCANRNFEPKQGLICGLTGNTPSFESNCQFFSTSEKTAESSSDSAGSETTPLFEMDEITLGKFRIHQDFYYAFMGGLFTTIISALIWAFVSVAAKFQIGYMALGVGFLVGYAVRFFGAGVDKKFGILGGILSLIGCLGGNLFTQVGFIAQSEAIGYIETFKYLSPSLIVSLLIETFSPMDLIFYGIAVFEGYKFSFRKISPREILQMKDSNYEAYPLNYKLRLPLVIVCIILISIFLYFANKGASGFKTFSYDSGAKMSEGEMVNGKQTGTWTYWYENGNRQQICYFTEGRADSSWQWFNESGVLVKTGNYKNGIEHGVWMTFYDNGIKYDSGSFLEGRMSGLWKTWYENGSLFQTGFYKRNEQDSMWHTYFENGKLNSQGLMKDGNPEGKWITYYENGNPESETVYVDENNNILKNAWDRKGNHIIKDGNGTYESSTESGKVTIKGIVSEGKRIGQWFLFYEDGRRKEELNYRNDSVLIINTWNPDGNENIVNGNGKYRNYFNDGTGFFEEGEIVAGKREGLWTIYHDTSDIVFQEQNYLKGVMNGDQTIYYESGMLYSAGHMTNGLQDGEWKWYYESGVLSSSVKFVNGKKEGKQIFLDENGEKSKVEVYKNGELIKETLL